MADNVTLPGTSAVVRTKDHSSVETQIVAFDVNAAGAEQLMASAALADGTTNPTLPSWATLAFVFNGTTWDRWRGDTTNGAWVNIKSSVTLTADTELTTADLDTGAGTDTRAVVGLIGSKSGGGVLIPGDATKGLAVDLTATGQNTTALKVDGSAVTQPVSDGGGSITVDGSVTADTELPAAGALADGASNPTTPTVGAGTLVYNGSTWDRARGDTTSGAWVNIKAGSVTSSGSDSTPNVHRNIKGVTATLSSQTDQATTVQLLASNSNRLGVTIVNDSTAILYVKFGTTASIAASGYNYKLQPDDTLEMPSGGLPLYTGRIDGIWSVDASGWANITEYT